MEQTVARKQTKREKMYTKTGQKGGRRVYGCFGMPWSWCLLLPDGGYEHNLFGFGEGEHSFLIFFV